jgi:hypothetical protein
MVPVGCQVIAHLVPGAPSLPGFPTGDRAAVPLPSLFQPAQALGALQLEAAGQILPGCTESQSMHTCVCRYCSHFCMLYLWL